MKTPRPLMIVALGLTLLSAPSAALPQLPAKVYLIGVLSTGGPEQENFMVFVKSCG